MGAAALLVSGAPLSSICAWGRWHSQSTALGYTRHPPGWSFPSPVLLPWPTGDTPTSFELRPTLPEHLWPPSVITQCTRATRSRRTPPKPSPDRPAQQCTAMRPSPSTQPPSSLHQTPPPSHPPHPHPHPHHLPQTSPRQAPPRPRFQKESVQPTLTLCLLAQSATTTPGKIYPSCVRYSRTNAPPRCMPPACFPFEGSSGASFSLAAILAIHHSWLASTT